MMVTGNKKMGARALLVLIAIFVTLLLFSSAVSAAMLGDINSDGVINVNDVILVNNYVLGSSTLTSTQISLADVNRDGVVDILDTVLIMQMTSGMIYEFPTLPAPALTSPANNALVGSTSVTFQWNAVSGATKYELEVMNSSTEVIFKNPELSAIFTFTTQYDFPNNGTPFRWRMRAGNNDGWGSWSAYSNFVSGTAPAGQTPPPPSAPAPSSPTVTLPAAPVLTVPTAGATTGGSSISFQWNPSSGANKYELIVTKVSDGSAFKTRVLGDQTYSTEIGFLSDGSQYRWKVRAGNTAGWGTWSTERTFTNSGTVGVPLLTSPAANANAFGSTVTFRWNAASGATRYKLELYKANLTIPKWNETPTWTQELGNVTSVSIPGFPNDGSEYKWRVQAGNLSPWNDSNWSADRTFSNGLLPAAPVLNEPATGVTVNGSSISFRWTAPTVSTGVVVDKYNLEIVRVRDGLVLRNLILGNTTSSLQTGFPNDGTEYKWRVRAGSKDGWGPWPEYISFTNGGLNAPVLTYPAANANIASSRITFEWRPVAGATKYRLVVYEGTGKDKPFIDVTLGSVYASMQRDFPNNGNVYTWEVLAGNRDGNWSPESTQRRTFTNGSSVGIPIQLSPVQNAIISPANNTYSPADGIYSAEFSWSEVSGASTYQLEVVEVRRELVVINNSSISNSNITTAPSTLNGFLDGEQYKWRVRAGKTITDWGTWSPYRDFVYYRTNPAALPAPSLLSPAPYATAASTAVTFKWTPVANAFSPTDLVYYDLDVAYVVGGGQFGGGYRNISPAAYTYSDDSISYPVSGFPNNSTQFMWRVRAVDGNNKGAWSLYQFFTNGFWWRW